MCKWLLDLLGLTKKTSKAYKGLAVAEVVQADFEQLRIGPRYVYSWKTGENWIPMLPDGEQPPYNYIGKILVYCEPNIKPPNGHPKMPEQAVFAVTAIEKLCPGAELIVGNVSADDQGVEIYNMPGWLWIYRFKHAYRALNAREFIGKFGIHSYGITAKYCIEQLERMMAEFDGDVWVTECAITNADVKEFEKLLDYLSNHDRITHYFIFTNRTRTVENFPYPVDLIDETGGLTELGKIFAKYPTEPT